MNFLRSVLLCLTILTANFAIADDLLITDFEAADYGSWKTSGEAFGPGPSIGTLPGQMAVSGFKGRGLANSFHQGDGTIGSLTSPEFKIERKYVGFLIGGGSDPQKTCMNLLVDGQIVRKATGLNDRPGGTEALIAEHWDVAELLGKTAMIQIIDNATGGWGHINVDHIVLTDTRPPGLLKNVQREFQVTGRYLNIPIKDGAPTRVLRVIRDGKTLVRNDIGFADGKPDWWAPMDVSAWAGSTIILEIDKLPDDSRALARIDQSDTIKNSENLYREPLRGQFHFSPKRGWNNDPNGMVYYNGEYHLFFQHNPYGWGWGNMHWGHAVSKDMVHWEELGDKLLPDEMGPMFSGSAVVDWQNTSGFGKPGKPAMILFYTAAGNPTVQCLAFSTDGRNFTKYQGNPIVKQITGGNRDPKVIWHEPSKHWVMTLYVEENKEHYIHFLTSTNLKDWKFSSKISGFYECPDFFELAVDGNPQNRKWVLTAANSEYMIGKFDGTTFTPETPKLPGHRGKGFYAAQTFSDIPATDGRRIQIGWFQTATKGMAFNQSMTIPLDLGLVTTPDGPAMTWKPVREMSLLESASQKMSPQTITTQDELKFQVSELNRVDIRFKPEKKSIMKMQLRGAVITYSADKQELSVNGQTAPARLHNGLMDLTIFCDRTGLEVFAAGGLTYLPMPFQPDSKNFSASVGSEGGSVRIEEMTANALKSSW